MSKTPGIISEGNHVGYTYQVWRSRVGYLCGYVFIPEGHPWFNKPYMDFVDEDSCVHGGLTFSILDPDTGCWVLGFDCYHAYDAPTPEEW
jgi:hypothetical protein